jgi:hypothetical protein
MGRRSSGSGPKFGAAALAAHMAFDKLTRESFIGKSQCVPPTPSRRICAAAVRVASERA